MCTCERKYSAYMYASTVHAGLGGLGKSFMLQFIWPFLPVL